MPNHLPTGDFPFPPADAFPSDYPSSFTMMSTAPLVGVVCSTAPNTWQPTVTTGGTTTVTSPNTGGYVTTHTYPYVVNTPFIGQVWASTSSVFAVEPEWTHRIWFNDRWTYYMQTSNVSEHILMNKRKIKQSCLLS